MGMYTGLRFKGIVKEAFRKDFECVALRGKWELLSAPKLNAFSQVPRASFIPCGSLCYMPSSWQKDFIDENGKRVRVFECDKDLPDEQVIFWRQTDTDGFNRQYDANTGYWSFQCSLKNYEDTIESFLELVPYFIEELIHCETFYEEDEESTFYTLKNEKIEII